MQRRMIKISGRTKLGTYQRMCRFREGACPDGNDSIMYIYYIFIMSVDFKIRGVKAKELGRGEDHGFLAVSTLLACRCRTTLVT